MRNFAYVIGSTDDFADARELGSAYFSGEIRNRNASVYEFKVNENSATEEFDLNEIATLIGRGLAFESWTIDDTVSILIDSP